MQKDPKEEYPQKNARTAEESMLTEDIVPIARYIDILIARKYWIIIPASAVFAIVLFFLVISKFLPLNLSMFPDVYTSKAKIVVSGDADMDMTSVLSGTMAGLATMSGMEIATDKAGSLIMEILNSRVIYEKIMAKYVTNFPLDIKLKGKYLLNRNNYRQGFKFSLEKKTDILSMSYTHVNPEFARHVLSDTVYFLDDELKRITAEKMEKERDLHERNASQVTEKILILESRMAAFQKEYGDVENMKIEAAQVVTKIATLKQEIITKQMERQTISQIMGKTNDQVKLLDIHIGNLKDLEKQLSEKLKNDDFTDIGFKYLQLKRDLIIQEKIFNIVITQYEFAKMQAAKNRSSFMAIEYPDLPVQKSGPHRRNILTITSLAALGIMVFLVLVLDLFIRPYILSRFFNKRKPRLQT
ncbi:MAG: hypothetical protein A2096_11065 [Spirochaetes bacterium GWF1_41_5]|nr:MAG: hypothetical protein A2096_11065 [Spirochaetes bacterium GWF1_41_5]HBE03334.1 hypothetical protein [Spirochaetia bacterium]